MLPVGILRQHCGWSGQNAGPNAWRSYSIAHLHSQPKAGPEGAGVLGEGLGFPQFPQLLVVEESGGCVAPAPPALSRLLEASGPLSVLLEAGLWGCHRQGSDLWAGSSCET